MDTENSKRLTIEEALAAHGVCILNTTGVSMRPLLVQNDAVTLKPVDTKIKKYDVLLYTDGAGRYILHRVVKIKGDTLIIRGDNTFIKEYVPTARVIARMVAYNSKGRHHTVEERGYRLYSRFWSFIYPVRLLLRKVKNLFGRLKRK